MAKKSKKLVKPGVDLDVREATFDYVKSGHFRVIHVDGLFGGISPRGGLINMAVWNERWPIPKQVVQAITANGKLGKEIVDRRVSRKAIVREVEAELVMDIPTAKELQKWLQEKIKDYEKVTKKSEKGVDK